MASATNQSCLFQEHNRLKPYWTRIDQNKSQTSSLQLLVCFVKRLMLNLKINGPINEIMWSGSARKVLSRFSSKNYSKEQKVYNWMWVLIFFKKSSIKRNNMSRDRTTVTNLSQKFWQTAEKIGFWSVWGVKNKKSLLFTTLYFTNNERFKIRKHLIFQQINFESNSKFLEFWKHNTYDKYLFFISWQKLQSTKCVENPQWEIFKYLQ